MSALLFLTKKEFSEILSVLSPYDFVAYGELEPFYYKVADWLNVSRENILLTSGSDAGIKSLYETFIEPNDEVLISLPNYAMFSVYAKMFGAKEIPHLYENNLELNVDKFCKNQSQTKLVIVSNPSHTGKVLDESDIILIIKTAEIHNALIVIDEAYFHFYSKTMVKYILKFKNLIVTRTFSKALGLASIRIGVLIGNKNIIKELYKVKLVHEITGVAAKIGMYMMNNKKIIDNYVNEVNDGKLFLYEEMRALGFQIFTTESNFLYFKTSENVKAHLLCKYLESHKIYIKGPFTNKPFDNHLRVTIGSKKQMILFCNKIREFLKSEKNNEN